MGVHTLEDLQQFQALPLNLKIRLTQTRIRTWVNEFGSDGVYVSFSGGKDSTVLLDIVRKMYPEIEAVFCDTGLEYPEIREFVKTFDNVTWLKPKMNFRKVIETYGYPFISKDVSQAVYDIKKQAKLSGIDCRETKLYNRSFNLESEYCKKFPTYCRQKYDYFFDADFNISHKCCDIMKKNPAKEFEKKTGKTPILATMAAESRIRRTVWLRYGCNAFESKRPKSTPMSFWTEQDVLEYIKKFNLPICSVYGDIVEENEIAGQMTFADIDNSLHQSKLTTTGASRTGCMFCGFGCSSKDWDNLIRMKETHPKQYEWIMKPWSDGGLGYKEVIDWINEHGDLNIRY